jgi:hypothetical protein
MLTLAKISTGCGSELVLPAMTGPSPILSIAVLDER